jgi:hypothetical protein
MKRSAEINGLRRRLMERLTAYSSETIADWHHAWQSINDFRGQVAAEPKLLAPWSLITKARQMRISQRQQAFQLSGGQHSTLVDHCLNKARSKD